MRRGYGDARRAVVAKGVYAYAHTFWDNDDDDEDGERESKEERRNRMNGKGEGQRDCFCIDEIWGYEDATRPRRELLCIRGLQCSLSRPNCLHTHTHRQHAPHVRVMSRRIGMKVKQREFPPLWGQCQPRCCQKKTAAKSLCRRLPRWSAAAMPAADRDIILIPILLDWGNIKLVVWPHDSGVFLSAAVLRSLAFS